MLATFTSSVGVACCARYLHRRISFEVLLVHLDQIGHLLGLMVGRGVHYHRVRGFRFGDMLVGLLGQSCELRVAPCLPLAKLLEVLRRLDFVPIDRLLQLFRSWHFRTSCLVFASGAFELDLVGQHSVCSLDERIHRIYLRTGADSLCLRTGRTLVNSLRLLVLPRKRNWI